MQKSEEKFIRAGDLKVSHNRSIRISKFRDGGGYSIVVMEIKKDEDGFYYKEPLKGAVIIPNDDKLVEFAHMLLDIAHKN